MKAQRNIFRYVLKIQNNWSKHFKMTFGSERETKNPFLTGRK